MEISTEKFGLIRVEENKIITFEQGILGFEEDKRYLLVTLENNKTFYWLQSVDNPALALPCMDPLLVCDNYAPEIEGSILEKLEVSKANLLVLCVVVIKPEMKKSTVNLAAPIIINTDKQKAMQVVLQNDKYHPRHLVFK